MANEPTEQSTQDVDFVTSMQELLGMDQEAVDQLLEKLNSDELQALTDAVAKHDKEAAEQVIGQSNSDDKVNALFRGANLQTSDQHATSKRKTNDGTMQFAFGDDVLVNIKGRDGKMHSVSATVAKPNGPEGTNTVVVKIKGKSTVVDKRNLDKLDENILGMMGLPQLGRVQQLAGMRTKRMGGTLGIEQIVSPEPDIEIAPEAIAPDPQPDDALGQAMAAFDTLSAALPNIMLADLKCVRERLSALQMSLNEGIVRSSAIQSRRSGLRPRK